LKTASRPIGSICMYIACTRVKTHVLQYHITHGRGSGESEAREEGSACYPLLFPPAASRACPSPVSPGASPRDLFPGRGLHGASDVAPDKKSSQDEPESPPAPEATGEPECPCCPFPPAAACVADASPLPPAGPNTFANRSSVFGPKWGCVIRGGCRGDP